MAISFYFQPTGFSAETYDEAIKQLEAAGAASPKGRSFHAGIEVNGQIAVFDIWDSQEDFEAFGPTLMPIMSALGAEPGEPMVAHVHNVIQG